MLDYSEFAPHAPNITSSLPSPSITWSSARPVHHPFLQPPHAHYHILRLRQHTAVDCVSALTDQRRLRTCQSTFCRRLPDPPSSLCASDEEGGASLLHHTYPFPKHFSYTNISYWSARKLLGHDYGSWTHALQRYSEHRLHR